MSPRRFDCVCAGIVVADHVCAPVERLPGAGELVQTDRLELTIGGCASNCAVDMARLGLSVALVGVVGADVLGRFVRDTLETAGVDCRHLAEHNRAGTAATLVINVAAEDRRFIHATGANAEFTAEDVPDELLSECRVLYLGGYLLAGQPTAEAVAALFARARAAGATTVLDIVTPGPGDYRPRLDPVLAHTDLFVPNDDEAALVTGLADPASQARAFRDAGAATVIITCGDRGAVLLGPDGGCRAGVHEVDFIDGTGSGDAFVAGYVYGLLAGGDDHRCLACGTAAGAACVEATGATTGALTADELEAFVEQHPLTLEPL